MSGWTDGRVKAIVGYESGVEEMRRSGSVELPTRERMGFSVDSRSGVLGVVFRNDTHHEDAFIEDGIELYGTDEGRSQKI
jgi:hypothetical protein